VGQIKPPYWARSECQNQLLRFQKQIASYELLIVDELGFVPLSKTGAELLFEMLSQRYERGSTLITSNLPFQEWTEILGSERLTGALLDRLTHHVHILERTAIATASSKGAVNETCLQNADPPRGLSGAKSLFRYAPEALRPEYPNTLSNHQLA
jgi:hypothetical protein